jgi:hypothetical protein
MEASTRHKLASGTGKHTVLLLTAAVLGFPLLWMVLHGRMPRTTKS